MKTITFLIFLLIEFLMVKTGCGQMISKKVFLDQYLFSTDSINAHYYKIISPVENDSAKTLASTFSMAGIIVSIEQYSDYEKKIKTGKSYAYHTNLKLKSIINFKEGKFHDTLQTFYSDGKIKRVDIFNEGKMITGKCFSKDGLDTIHFPYEIMARYPGGENAMIQYLKKNTNYPKKARKNNVDGTVYVKFIVNRSGEIVKLKVSKSVHPLLDEEAIRVVSNMGKWIPGK